MPSPASRQVVVGVGTERVLHDPAGAAGFADDAHVGGAAGLADLFEFQDRAAVGALAAAVRELLPREVVEVPGRARDEEPGRDRGGSAASAPVMEVAGPVGPVDGDVELEPAAVDG